ncbi:MAG TPA: AI-2E family transporter [Candidatus Cybelea sp.]|nr:AI-2E family transporter [Candidatus Cybelea sp.]
MSGRAQIVFWLLGALALAILLYLLRGIMLPFVAGFGIAYLLDPVADRMEARGLSRTLSTSIVVLVFFGLLALAIVLLAPVVERQVAGLVNRVPDLIERGREELLPVIGSFLEMLHIDVVGEVKGAVAGSADRAAGAVTNVLQRILGGGLAFIHVVLLLVITPIVAFYMLRDWDRLVARIDSWLPREHAETIRAEMREISDVLAGFMRGQAIVCAVLGTYYAIALSAAGLQYGLLIGLITGALVFIPFVGTTFGLIASMSIAAVQFWPDWKRIAVVLAIFAVGHFAESNIISPRLVGEKVGLHPVWIIFSLLAFATLFGFLGVLLAVPAAAVIGVLVRFAVRRYLASPIYLGRGPPGSA